MVKINIPKTKKILDSLLILHNEVRSMIFVIVLGAEEKQEEMSITDIHKELKKRNIQISSKNCWGHVKELVKSGLLQEQKERNDRGQRTIIKPTEKAHNIAKFLVGIKANFF